MHVQEKVEEESRTRYKIRKAISDRYERIDGEIGRMLTSILDKPFNKIKIDRVFEEEEGSRTLYTDPSEVLEKTRDHFKEQFKERKIGHVEKEINEFYKPLEDVNEEWYASLKEEITLDEWLDAVRGAKNKTAPGVSDIEYSLIKNASKETHELFRNFAGACIKLGRIPLKWKIAQIYPIPKSEEWGYRLNNIIPIALLETFRKCVTKLLTKRIAKVVTERNILQGPNFAGLPGCSTEDAIHTVEIVKEDARENGKELWIVLQDMKKAYRTVSIKMLERALHRIKIPEITTKFLLELFSKRKIRVITKFGVMRDFETGDGIEQGETISLLI